MRSQFHQRHVIERGLIVPMSATETYIANEWRLGDEPGGDGARIYPPIFSSSLNFSGGGRVHRVPNNTKKLSGATCNRDRSKAKHDNETDISARAGTQ